MPTFARSLYLSAGAALAVTALCLPAVAATVCVNPAGSGGCYSTIQAAVNQAAANDVIHVGPGVYNEGVVIGIPLSLLGAGAGVSTINAAGQPNGVLLDGFHHPGLQSVTVAGFTVENALYEGILTVSATNATIRDNSLINNDATPGLNFTGATNGCPGQPAYETDETGDCGGAIHLIGTSYSVVSGNYVTGNADGILISDETMISQGNLVTQNIFSNNPLECGIVLASHPPVGSVGPFYAPHYGVVHNTVSDNLSLGNGVQIGGSGVGLFSDGNGPGRVSENTIIRNIIIGNGIGGVNLHTHVGPSFHAPPDNMDNNSIIGNYIASNRPDTFDTATPGSGVGINISSGDGGSPVLGTVITGNIITDEDVDIAVNTAAPGVVDIHQNALLPCSGAQCTLKLGVANVCAYDQATSCGGVINASENYWGCSTGPGAAGCSSIEPPYAANILFTPWLTSDPAYAPASGDACNSVYHGAFPKDLNVSEGQSCAFVGGSITGNTMQKGGYLVLFGTDVTGNVQSMGGTASLATNITGNLEIQNQSGGAGQDRICGSTVRGNLQFHNNAVGGDFGDGNGCAGNVVGGNLEIHDNSLPITVFGDTITGNLDAHNNTGPIQIFGDTVDNNLSCQNNSFIQGGMDKAKQKQGQCSGF